MFIVNRYKHKWILCICVGPFKTTALGNEYGVNPSNNAWEIWFDIFYQSFFGINQSLGRTVCFRASVLFVLFLFLVERGRPNPFSFSQLRFRLLSRSRHKRWKQNKCEKQSKTEQKHLFDFLFDFLSCFRKLEVSIVLYFSFLLFFFLGGFLCSPKLLGLTT